MHDNNDAHKLVVGCVRHAPRVAEAIGESISITEELLNGRRRNRCLSPTPTVSISDLPNTKVHRNSHSVIWVHQQSFIGVVVFATLNHSIDSSIAIRFTDKITRLNRREYDSRDFIYSG